MVDPIRGTQIPAQMYASRRSPSKAKPINDDTGPDNRTLTEIFDDMQTAIAKAKTAVLREHGKTEQDFDAMTPEEKISYQPEIDDLADNHPKHRGADGKRHDVSNDSTEEFLQAIGSKYQPS